MRPKQRWPEINCRLFSTIFFAENRNGLIKSKWLFTIKPKREKKMTPDSGKRLNKLVLIFLSLEGFFGSECRPRFSKQQSRATILIISTVRKLGASSFEPGSAGWEVVNATSVLCCPLLTLRVEQPFKWTTVEMCYWSGTELRTLALLQSF